MTFKRWFNKDKKEKLELGLGEVLLEELYNEKCEIEKKYVSGISEITRQKNYVNFYKAANNNRAKEIKNLRKENAELKALIKSEHEIEARKNNRLISKLTKAKEIIKELLGCYKYVIRFREYADKKPIAKAEQFLNGDGCPDCLCEDCTKEDCTVRKLGLVEK